MNALGLEFLYAIQNWKIFMRRHLNALVIAVAISPLLTSPAVAAIDLPADLNRISTAIAKFDANSATTSTASTISDLQRIFSNNALILREIRNANAYFKNDLNSAKRYIPTKDTKDTPAFSTLMNLTKGYEDWLKYQDLNQAAAQKCMKYAGASFTAFGSCSILSLSKTLENEKIGRFKLQTAWNAWKQWQVKYGYA